jgi:hypothetical protein
LLRAVCLLLSLLRLPRALLFYLLLLLPRPFLLLTVPLHLLLTGTFLMLPIELLLSLLLRLPRALLFYLLSLLPGRFLLLIVPLHLLLTGAFLLLPVQLVLTVLLRLPRTLLLHLLLLLARPFLLLTVPLTLLPFLPVLIGRPPLLGTVRLRLTLRPLGPASIFFFLLFFCLFSARLILLLRVSGITDAEDQAQGCRCHQRESLHEFGPLELLDAEGKRCLSVDRCRAR